MEPSKKMVEAGARALVSSLCVYIDMDAPNMQHQADYYRRIAADVLRSAMVGVEVVLTNEESEPLMVDDSLVHPGDTLVIIRAGGE